MPRLAHGAFLALVLVALGWMALATSPSVAGLARDQAREPVSPVIFPAQDIPLRFSHVQHLTQKGTALTCEGCHTAAPDSLSSLDNLMPRESACKSCHDIDRQDPQKAVPLGKPAARCDACHVGFDPVTRQVLRVRIPVPQIKFDHRLHVRGQNMACTTCHTDLAGRRVDLATVAELPKMRLCLGCHDGKRAASRCVTCHLAGSGGMIQTTFPGGMLEPSGVLYGDAHDLSFRTEHAAAAQNNMDYCGNCHGKRFCVDCHNGVVKPMDFHVSDYVTLHALDARRNTPDCSTCHRSQTFCTGCHSRSGVSADGRGSEFDGTVPERRFHPEGWSALDRSGPNHHAFEAQRNIKQCAACHREEFCTGCHSAQADSMKINPHPPGFGQSRRCRALLAKNGRMCLRCHVGVDEARCN